ncbi:hypothetical protein Dsin_001016 [Dipteronia sinensis]|uniref:Uncharacterized protein n=1 Tax=Dipteronia sinensis TaxID=43782 RepID=A0AAE0EJX0_9ROSI|nr:hypothetical protein Dsin_001016 [Dipteronia sinensis]
MDASKWQFYRARNATREMIDGAVKKQHSKLREYAAKKGLIYAIVERFPYSEHRFCVKHMYNNFKAQHRGLLLKQILWGSAKAITEQNNPNNSRQANNHYDEDDQKLPDNKTSEVNGRIEEVES